MKYPFETCTQQDIKQYTLAAIFLKCYLHNSRDFLDPYLLSVCTPEMSPKKQRTVVHKRLTMVAEEIFRILEIVLADCEADVSHSQQGEINHQRKLLDLRQTYLHKAGLLMAHGMFL